MAAAEVESLQRVLHRLGITDDDKLQGVLEKLLPLVLKKLDLGDRAVQQQVLSILSHVNTRIAALPEVSLPLLQLLKLYATSANPLVRNFALVYIERAMERASPESQLAAVPLLLAGVAARPPQQRDMQLRMAVAGLAHLATVQGGIPAPAEVEAFAARHPFLKNDGDRRAFLQFAMRVALYAPMVGRGPSSALAAARQAPAGGAAGTAAAVAGLPLPGLSHEDIAAILGKAERVDAATLQRRKLGVLNFTALAGIDPADVLPFYLAASCDPAEAVARRGEELLKKRCAVDAARPCVDVEAFSTVTPLFELFHGCMEDETRPAASRRAPAAPALKSRLLALFCKSVAAANAAPWGMMTITSCLFDPSAPPRLRQQGMEFSVWMLKHADAATLAPAAPAVLETCLSLLDASTVTANTTDANTLALRGFAYQALGQLAQRLPAALKGRVDLAERCFTGLAVEPAGVRAAVAEATSSIAAAFEGEAEEQRDSELNAELLRLLEGACGQPQEAARGSAIAWLRRLFPFNHLQARYLCIMGSADARPQLAAAAAAGLRPEKVKPGAAREYPSLAAMLQYLQARHPEVKSPVEDGRRLAVPAKAFSAAIAFLEECRRHGDGGARAAAPPEATAAAAAHLVLLENALVREAPSELHAAALQGMLDVAGAHPAAFAESYCRRPSLFERLSGHIDASARDAAGRLLGMLCAGMTPEQAQRLVASTQATVDATAGASSAGSSGTALKKPRFEESDGATAALGYVMAQLVCGVPAVPPSVILSALGSLRKQLESDTVEAILRAAAARALGCAGIPLGDRPSVNGATQSIAHALPALPEAPALAAATAALLADRDEKVARKAAQALGFLAYGHRSPEVLNPVVEAMLGQRACKSEGLAMAVGESLCLAFGAVEVSSSDILRAPFTSLADLNRTDTREEGKTAKQMETNEAEQKQQQQQLSPDSPAEEEVQDKVLAAILEECVGHTRPEVRRSGAVWLVSLLLFCGRAAAVRAALPRSQEALCALLADGSELTQAMASRGLAAAAELADDETRSALVGSLVDALTGGGAAGRLRAGAVTADTKLFDAGTLGNAPGGGGLTTYKEICSLATEVGQPDMVYKFMSLANAQAAANASVGAAFGFASVAKLAGDSLAPQLGKLVPRLYRSLYDPSPKVSAAMHHIWVALVDDPRVTLTLHFDAVATALLADMTGPQWRVRESAASAAADLVQGRRWPELRPHFAGFWRAAFRVTDDVKESVREAGGALLRAVRGVTLRLADPELSPPAEGREALATALPLLLELGLPSRVPEVQALALDTTANIVKAAGPALVRPQLPTLIPPLLESLSGLEDSRLNYVEQHAERIGLDAGRLEAIRVSAAQGGAVGETLDVCARHIDGETFAALAPALGGLVRRGTGLATRAGAGRFITTVARKLGPEAAPAAPTLMRALQEACAAERSPAVQRSYAAANAVLAKHASVARVESHVTAWLQKYNADDADASSREVSGLLLKSLAREAGDVLVRCAAEVAPVAYLAQFDPDTKTAELWAEVWEESTTSVGAGLRLHMVPVLAAIQAGLKAGQWGRKRAAAAAAAAACTSAGDSMAPHAPQLMQALLAELPGRLWEGKEAILTAIGAAAVGCALPLQRSDAAMPSTVAGALLEAAGKKKTVYRREALVQLKKVLEAWKDVDFVPQVVPTLLSLRLELVASSQQKPAASEADNGAATTAAASRPPIAELMECLGAAWAGGKLTTVSSSPHGTAWVAEGLEAAAAAIDAATRPTEQAAALGAALQLARRCTALSSETGPDLVENLGLGGGSNVGRLLDPVAPACQALLRAAAKAVEEGKAAAQREQAVQLLGCVLEQVWGGMSEEERVGWREMVEEVGGREKVTSVKAATAKIMEGLM